MGRNPLAINAYAETSNLLEKHMITKINNALLTFAQKVSTAAIAPTERQARATLFLAGVSLLVFGLSVDGVAQFTATKYNDNKVPNAVNAIMTYLEGSFGALFMATAGLGCIIAAAIGRYNDALLYLGLAVGTFLSRSLMSTCFNDTNIQD